ncbi:hypothetical protein N0V90_000250 [Kalmusia sp. IMI 367209]|nr:hypothetical protein N0V90_000250 [Kalmusia sp. IMI 367209]
MPYLNEWNREMFPECGAPGYHKCDEKSTRRKYHYLVPPVCKQFWNEASECAWKTITFAFVTSGDFQHFVYYSGAPLDLIQKLCIIAPGSDFDLGIHPFSAKAKYDKGWVRALDSGVMERFTSLVGLHLVLRLYWGTSRWDTHVVEDLIYPPHECLYLPEIIREFQKLNLRPEHTTVLITNGEHEQPYGYDGFTIPMRRKLAQVIRNFILQDEPDRDWSGPGQRMVIWPARNTDNEHLYAPYIVP